MCHASNTLIVAAIYSEYTLNTLLILRVLRRAGVVHIWVGSSPELILTMQKRTQFCVVVIIHTPIAQMLVIIKHKLHSRNRCVNDTSQCARLQTISADGRIRNRAQPQNKQIASQARMRSGAHLIFACVSARENACVGHIMCAYCIGRGSLV